MFWQVEYAFWPLLGLAWADLSGCVVSRFYDAQGAPLCRVALFFRSSRYLLSFALLTLLWTRGRWCGPLLLLSAWLSTSDCRLPVPPSMANWTSPPSCLGASWVLATCWVLCVVVCCARCVLCRDPVCHQTVWGDSTRGLLPVFRGFAVLVVLLFSSLLWVQLGLQGSLSS